jgi:uncharacterized protein (TIGR02453 family)
VTGTVPGVGFPGTAFDFFSGLAADNSRDYVERRRAVLDQDVRAPLAALLARLAGEFGEFRTLRLHRDVRFTRDKSPYKTMLGAVHATAGGTVRYVHVDAAGLTVVSGMHTMAPDQVARFRQAVADDTAGSALATVAQAVGEQRARLEPGVAEPLRTVPRGYPRDHPRGEWLRWKGLMSVIEITDRAALRSPDLADPVADHWRASRPLDEWLTRHVGPSTTPARRRT